MKRPVLTILRFLPVGAVVNVAMAWACVWGSWSRHDVSSTPSWFQFERRAYTSDPIWIRGLGWTPRLSDERTAYPVESTVLHSVGWASVSISEQTKTLDNRVDFHGEPCRHIVTVTTAGWPIMALRGEQWMDYRAEPVLRTSSYGAYREYPWINRGLLFMQREWLYAGSGLACDQSFPFRPLWPGFAINTVFYAFILWLLFAGPFVLRRRRRIHRGLCPKCAYDLRATQTSVCPECGEPNARKVVQA